MYIYIYMCAVNTTQAAMAGFGSIGLRIDPCDARPICNALFKVKYLF